MLIVANWKAYVETPAQAVTLFESSKKLVSKNVEIVLAPSALYLGLLGKNNRSNVALAAQDVSVSSFGAATGELPALMLKNAGASHAIIGHSERRTKGETNELVLEKVQAALLAGLTPIVCVGETERDEDGKYLNVMRAELHSLFSVLPEKERTKIVIAYEPIWAIGKGALQAITPADLNEMIRYIRKILGEYVSGAGVKKIRVLYGGSADASNVRELMTSAPIDGFLVGRASIDTKTFAALVKNVSS